jgi:hypothetical protein
VKGFTIAKNNEKVLIKAQIDYLKASHITWSAGKSNDHFKSMNMHQRDLQEKESNNGSALSKT